MNYLKITLLFITGFLTFEGHAQSKSDNALPGNSFIIKIDSLEIDIYKNYESDLPPLNLNKLREPTLFILDEQELEISTFSELKLDKENIQSVTIIQDPDDIKELGYSRFNSIVKVKTAAEK